MNEAALRYADALDCHEHEGMKKTAAELRRLVAINAELVEALEVLADEANAFNVSGVYFNENCMGHKGLDMAEAALEKAKQ